LAARYQTEEQYGHGWTWFEGRISLAVLVDEHALLHHGWQCGCGVFLHFSPFRLTHSCLDQRGECGHVRDRLCRLEEAAQPAGLAVNLAGSVGARRAGYAVDR